VFKRLIRLTLGVLEVRTGDVAMKALPTSYPSDLSDAEWDILEPLLPPTKPGGRNRLYSMRDIVNAIQYVLRSGCAWRMLPKDYPHWESAYHYFRCWTDDGTWQRIHDQLHQRLRRKMGRKARPSGGIIDSQSVKTTEKGGSMAMTGPRRSADASVISSLIQRVSSVVSSSRQRTSATPMSPQSCSGWRSRTSAR
jgi:transposase